MKFSETGLPNNKLVEDAFNYAQKHLSNGVAENLKDVEQQIRDLFADNFKQLEDAKAANKVTDDQYNLHKAAINKKLQENLAKAPQFVMSMLTARFKSHALFSAKEAATAEQASPELIAAALLSESMRSPVDSRNIAAAVSPVVADILDHTMHLDAYQAGRATHLKTVSDDVKRLFLIGFTCSLNEISGHAKRGAKIKLPPGTEADIFDNAKEVWGTDAKLEKRFTDLFNQTMSSIGSPYTIAVSEKGEPQLVKGGRKPNGPRPPSNGGPGSIGDNVF